MQPDTLATLVAPVNPDHFLGISRRLHDQFKVYAATCPAPLPAAGLIITSEIRNQCECYLPLSDVRSAFYHLYRDALNYPPVFSSTPFHNALSWADTFTALTAKFQFSANPAQLLDALLEDAQLLTRFLFASFLPKRFYGVIGRYPSQQQYIKKWLDSWNGGTLRCLDTACGTGEDTFGLALLLAEHGFSPEEVLVSGWTVEPLEVWVASHRRFPHEQQRETLFGSTLAPLFSQGFGPRITFDCQDILEVCGREIGSFNVVICNGLLGGPLLHQQEQLQRAVTNLAKLLTPGGILLAADMFHGGWKQKCPQDELRALFEKIGLNTFTAGEGIGGLKSD